MAAAHAAQQGSARGVDRAAEEIVLPLTHSGGGAGIVCQSNKASPGYADGNWHMFAAIRTNGQACTLDMDGPTYNATNQFTGGGSNNGGDKMSTDSPAYIGQAPTAIQGPTYPFVGSLDTILWWNSNALTDTTAGNQKNMIGEIYKKNYGTKAHLATPSTSKGATW